MEDQIKEFEVTNLKEKTRNIIEKANQKICKEIYKQHNVILEQIRKKVTPPIKGKITLGKLVWRGIKIEIADEEVTYKKTEDGLIANRKVYYNISQRGVLIDTNN